MTNTSPSSHPIRPLIKLASILCLTFLIFISSIEIGRAQGQKSGHKYGHQHGHGSGKKSYKRAKGHTYRYSGRYHRGSFRYRQGRKYRYNGSTWILVNPPIIIIPKKFSGIVSGRVTFAEGDMMPGPDVPNVGPRAVQRQIGFFRLTTFAQTTAGEQTGFFTNMGSKPILTTWSANDGNYRARLRPSTYTVCVREAGQWYANLSDHLGQINPVQLLPDSNTHHDLLINYKAVY